MEVEVAAEGRPWKLLAALLCIGVIEAVEGGTLLCTLFKREDIGKAYKGLGVAFF